MVTQNVLLGRGTERLPQKNTIIGSGSDRIDADTICRRKGETAQRSAIQKRTALTGSV